MGITTALAHRAQVKGIGLTIRKQAGLPARQDPVQLLPERPEARVSEQVLIASFSVQMLQHTNTQSDE